MFKSSAAAFVATKERTQGSNDIGKNAEPLVKEKASGY
jgi:hypothetical protein